MVMQAQPIYDCFQSIVDRIEGSYRCLYMTPQGKTFKQAVAKQYVKEENLIFLCGHYEGVDERVIEEIVDDYVSLGDFVLTGGELPAIVMVDAISRLIPGVLHNDDSALEEENAQIRVFNPFVKYINFRYSNRLKSVLNTKTPCAIARGFDFLKGFTFS